MQCTYLLFNGLCGAHPPDIQQEFRPDNKMKEDYCENDAYMRACPRLQQYLDYLEASHTKKKTKEKSNSEREAFKL